MNALRSTVRVASRTATQRLQKRQMGSGAQVQWTGIDKVIRDRFPEDYQVAGLILGGYTTLFMLVKIWPSSKKEVEAAPVAKAAADTGTIPSVEDEAFAEFIENEENLQKWIDSAE